MATSIVETLELLRNGDPTTQDHIMAYLVFMARRCVPPEADAEAVETVAREAMDEVLGRIANANNDVASLGLLQMWMRSAVGRAARRATPPSDPSEEFEVTTDMLRRGDPEAIRRFYALLVRMARRFIPSQVEAASVANEAMVEVLSRADRDEQPERLVEWANNAVSSAARRRIRRYKRAPATLRSGFHTELAQPRGSIALHSRDQLEQIRGIIQTLPVKTQQALVAIWVDGRSIESVATEFGMPASTLRNQLHRARAKFRKSLARAEVRERLTKIARKVRPTLRRRSDDSSTAVR